MATFTWWTHRLLHDSAGRQPLEQDQPLLDRQPTIAIPFDVCVRRGDERVTGLAAPARCPTPGSFDELRPWSHFTSEWSSKVT